MKNVPNINRYEGTVLLFDTFNLQISSLKDCSPLHERAKRGGESIHKTGGVRVS